MAVLALVLLAVWLVGPLSTAAEAPTLEERLGSKDPAVARTAVGDVIAGADRAEPLSLMLAAARQFELGDAEQAVFWFYAGQLRARYAPELTGDKSQVVTIYTMTLGEPINAHAMRDIVTLLGTIARAMRWDERTFETWARAHALDPDDEQLRGRRTSARESLVVFATDLKKNRQHYEKVAREYKSPEQVQREAEENVRKNYTTAPVDRVVGGRTLRVPANYLSAQGLTLRSTERTSEVAATVFLPDYAGYTLDNWRNLSGNKALLSLRLRGDSGPKPDELIEAFIATAPPTTQAFGFEAYQFDARQTKARLPLQGYSVNYVLVNRRPEGTASYLICDAPEPGITKTSPRCELFAIEPVSGLRLHARFHQDHARQWQRIEARLGEVVKGWLVER
jgi:hypothetical protein